MHSPWVHALQSLMDRIKTPLALRHGFALTNLGMAKISGNVTVPGLDDEQGAFHSKLAGIYSTVCMVNHVCQYYSITNGNILFGCDGLSALQQYFNRKWHISPNTAHHNLIQAICTALKHLPITWKWQHMCGHQDQAKPKPDLTMMEQLNIAMDDSAKLWWKHLEALNYRPQPALIPGEGWSIFLNNIKLATFSREIFDLHIQSQYSKQYWMQPKKLGNLYHMIDWLACSNAR